MSADGDPGVLGVPILATATSSTAVAVPLLRREAGEFAAANGAAGSLLDDIVLGVSEVVTNVVRHAYPAAGSGPVRLIADVEGDDLQIVVEDDGLGMRAGDEDGPGTGLSTVASHCTDFAIATREPHGTSVWMRFRLAG